MPPAANRNMRVRNEIRRLRFERDEMTQQDLADRIGVTRQTVNAIEAAKCIAHARTRIQDRRRVREALGEVFHYEEEQLGHRRNDPAKS